MLNHSIRILNFDNSVARQNNFISQYKPEILDLEYFAPQARLWMDKRIERQLDEQLKDLTPNSITFLGSGDFHHLTYSLLKGIQEPFTLIVFDFHPDWDTLPPRMGCGSWVRRSLKKANLLKCVLLGISSSDISTGAIQSGNLASLKNNRLEIYPYRHKPSRVFFKNVPENISIKLKKGFLGYGVYWDELENKDLEAFFISLIKRLPTRKVYLSIDKDCLKKEYSLTNWEEGLLSLDELLKMLTIIRDNLDIIAVDIAGDYSPISVSGRVKGFFSRLDHPKKVPAEEASGSLITATNEATNLKILEALL